MEAIIKILAFVAIVIILIFLITRIWDYYKKQSKKMEESKIRPPLEYMNDVGIKCPDYWTYVGKSSDGTTYKCVNTFQLPVKDVSKCYTSNTDDKMYEFKALTEGINWNNMSDKERKDFVKSQYSTELSRCGWLTACGGVWLGVEDKCN
jgi:hypothetical protein